MNEALRSTLSGWAEFYVLTGTAAAALTGLQFVVQTLFASESVRMLGAEDPEGGIAAFSSPTVVHLTLALVISSAMCAPWPGFASLRLSLVVIGGGALAYSAIVLRRARAQRSYQPVFEDWLWHFLLPSTAYAGVLVSALLLHRGAEGPLFVVGAATLLLLCVAIHNAWDTITYFTMSAIRHRGTGGAAPNPPPDAPDGAAAPGDE
jgi:hypothetical protein